MSVQGPKESLDNGQPDDYDHHILFSDGIHATHQFDLSPFADYGDPDDIAITYTEADCWALACEVQDRTGWDLVIVSQTPEQDYLAGRYGICHALAVTPDGLWMDALGLWEPDDALHLWAAHLYQHGPMYAFQPQESGWEHFEMHWSIVRDEADESLDAVATGILAQYESSDLCTRVLQSV